MSFLSRNTTHISVVRGIIPAKIIAFIFSLMSVAMFFFENIHVPDNFQPFLAVFIFLFWDLIWLIILQKFLGITVKNQ